MYIIRIQYLQLCYQSHLMSLRHLMHSIILSNENNYFATYIVQLTDMVISLEAVRCSTVDRSAWYARESAVGPTSEVNNF